MNDFPTFEAITGNASYASLKDRVAVVTGGGQGLGRSYAHFFAAHGAVPVIADLDGDNAARVAAEIADAGGRALGLGVDVADETATLDMAARVEDAFGRIDILINNAAVFSRITMLQAHSCAPAPWCRRCSRGVGAGSSMFRREPRVSVCPIICITSRQRGP